MKTMSRKRTSHALRLRAAGFGLVYILIGMVVAGGVIGFIRPHAVAPGASDQRVAAKLDGTKKLYSSDEQPTFQLQLQPAATSMLDAWLEPQVWADSLPKVTVSYGGHLVDDVQATATPVDNGYRITLKQDQGHLKPGSYVVEAKGSTSQGSFDQTQTFAWGVLALNPTKASYLPGETAEIDMGVLSSTGHTICDAPVVLTITDPSGHASTPDVAQSGVCDGDTYVNAPDYTAHYTVGGVGKYNMELRLGGSSYVMSDTLTVSTNPLFTVERHGPSRIYPLSAYTMPITITPAHDFSGSVEETVPSSFAITEQGGANIHSGGDTQTITWQVDWKAGATYSLAYTFKAPPVSPAFYNVGPLTMHASGDKRALYSEPRRWQIASDAVITFIKQTVLQFGTAAQSFTLPVTSTAGDSLIMLMSTNATGCSDYLNGITDNGSNTWVNPPGGGCNTNPPSEAAGNISYYAMGYTMSAAATTSIVATIAGGVARKAGFNVVEFRNLDNSTSVDQSNAANNAASLTMTTPSITTTNAEDLIIGGISAGGSATPTETLTTAGFTSLTDFPPSTVQNGSAAYRMVHGTGAYSISWTSSNSFGYGTGIMAFQGATGYSTGCVSTVDDQMRGGESFCNGVKAGFFWAQ